MAITNRQNLLKLLLFNKKKVLIRMDRIIQCLLEKTLLW